MSATTNLSVRLQDIAQSLSDVLSEVAGEPVAFVLVLGVDNVAQYISNCKREEGTEMLEGLLSRWKVGRADIPAHYNPDLSNAKAG